MGRGATIVTLAEARGAGSGATTETAGISTALGAAAATRGGSGGAVWAKYNVTAVEEDPELVDHVAYTLLVDRTGKSRVLYDSQVKSAQVVHDVRLLLAA